MLSGIGSTYLYYVPDKLFESAFRFLPESADQKPCTPSRIVRQADCLAGDRRLRAASESMYYWKFGTVERRNDCDRSNWISSHQNS